MPRTPDLPKWRNGSAPPYRTGPKAELEPLHPSVSQDVSFESELDDSKSEFRKELAPTRLADLQGPEKELAEKITAGKSTNREKAFAIYDWTVENIFRDPNTKGCGLGEVDTLIRTLGGKCGDILSVYTALARASGVPAREVFGIRIPSGKEGDMTKAQHCWVVVDPADVRKAILEKKITLEQAKPLNEDLFGFNLGYKITFREL